MNTYKVWFKNGDSLITSFNGTIEEAKRYYMGKVFNLGNSDRDLMATGVKVIEV